MAWDKPGHDGKALRGTVTGRRPTADAIRVVIVVAKTRNRCYQYWRWPNHSPLGASGREIGRPAGCLRCWIHNPGTSDGAAQFF
jgi:hypothetical protein